MVPERWGLGKNESEELQLTRSLSSSSPTPSPERHEDSLEKSDYSVVVAQWLLAVETPEKGESGVLRWVLGALGR